MLVTTTQIKKARKHPDVYETIDVELVAVPHILLNTMFAYF